jgi:germination protein YpeB
MGILLGVTFFRKKAYQLRLDNIYTKTYYEIIDLINDVEVQLSKLNVSSSSKLQRSLLLEMWNKCCIIQLNLSQLSIHEEKIIPLIKFFNQLGDYSKHLANNNEYHAVSSKDNEQLRNLHVILISLQSALSETSDLIMAGNHFVNGLEEEMRIFDSCFDKITNKNQIEYPPVTYDGHFSDQLANKNPVFLENLSLINIEIASNIVYDKFEQASAVNILTHRYGSIEAYVFEVKWAGGIGTVCISKQGGYVVDYIQDIDVTNPRLNEEECTQKALAILNSLGYYNMQAVWIANINSVVYINFASCINDIIYYSDNILVKINSETGYLMGFDACNYIYNHSNQRETIYEPIDIEKARKELSPNLYVKSEKLCVIPIDSGCEKIAYEFYGSYLESDYLVYIDALTLEELKILKIIEGEWGKMVI